MKDFIPNIRSTITLTPAIFLLAFWILVLSDSASITSTGLKEMLLWALLLSFGTAYSITVFVSEILKRNVRA